MKKITILILCLSLFFVVNSFAQPPCLFGSNGVPATNEAPGCLMCAAAYQGNNGGYTASVVSSCGAPDNSLWVAIYPDNGGNIDLNLFANNCAQSKGLELTVFDSSGVEIICDTNLNGNGGSTLIDIPNLNVGELYSIMIDGIDADVCDFTLGVRSGINGVPDPIAEIRMDPDTVLCPGATVCFDIDAPANSTEYSWVVPPNLSIISGGGPSDLSVCCVVTSPGGGALTVTPSNPCFSGFPAILPVIALPIPPAIWPPIFVCNSDMPFDTTVCGQNYNTDQYGAHQITCTTALGCDSVINFSLIPKVQVPNIIDTLICGGDCIQIGDSCYTSSAIITISDVQENGCDSTVNLMIQNLSPISSIAVPAPLDCAPGATITLDGSGSSSGVRVAYDWRAFDGGTIETRTDSNQVVVSSAGRYYLTVAQSTASGAVCITTDTVEVISGILSDPVISCAPTPTSVSFSWDPVFGALDYNINIDGVSSTQSSTTIDVTGLSTGDQVSITVRANSQIGCHSNVVSEVCTAQLCPSTAITLPPINDICLDQSTMPIQLATAIAPNFMITWSGIGVLAGGMFDPSVAGVGTHTLTATIVEGSCTVIETVAVEVIDSPIIDETIEQPIWELGGSGNISLNVNGGSQPYSYQWSNGSVDSNQTALSLGQYCITVTSQDGCSGTECYQINGGYSVAPIHLICSGEFANLAISPNMGATFNWTPAMNLSCTDCAGPMADPTKTTVYRATITLPDGRSASQNIVVVVLPNFICNGLQGKKDKEFTNLFSNIDIQNIEEAELVELEKQITDYYLAKEVKVVPNPTTGLVSIETVSNFKTVEIFDFAGKKLKSEKEKQINLSNFSKGVYFFKIKIEDDVIIKKVVLL